MTDNNGEFEELKGVEFWNPENEGDILEGVVKQIVEGDYGKQYDILDLHDRMVRTSSHAFLQSKLSGCKVGDYIKIEFKGENKEMKKKGQNAPKEYLVFRKKK